jgi:V/A-type H+-transporting ATPase subunit I
LKHFSHKNATPLTGGLLGEWIIHWLIELMEFFINSMSNTLSFIRVAALGIAHVALMSALYGIADKAPNFLVALVVIVLTNVLVIALEGFSAGINSVRLNYYEFFGRYFLGGGTSYSPLSLYSRKD